MSASALVALLATALAVLVVEADADGLPFAIGYSRVRTNVPGRRYANAITMRAWLVSGDGTGGHELASELITKPGTYTQFVGWSPDGRMAIVGCGWESEENGRWEEEHREFRFAAEHILYDTHLLDLASGRLNNVTAVGRVSFYNTGVFFWPDDPKRLGFQALIGDPGVAAHESHPFSMNWPHEP